MDNEFDNSIILFLNQFSQRSHFADLLIYHFFWNNMLKGGVIVALFYWVWFKDGAMDFSKRAKLTAALLFSALSAVVARAIALGLPYRSRPMHTPALHFKLTFGMQKDTLEHWSSFPSDHAALFFGLSMGLFLVNRRVGLIALFHTTLFICLPRLYLGVHYATDLTAGALIGMGMAWLATRNAVSRRVARPAAEWREWHEGSFYAVFFLATYEIANLFEGSRGILSAAVKAFTKSV